MKPIYLGYASSILSTADLNSCPKSTGSSGSSSDNTGARVAARRAINGGGGEAVDDEG